MQLHNEVSFTLIVSRRTTQESGENMQINMQIGWHRKLAFKLSDTALQTFTDNLHFGGRSTSSEMYYKA